MAEQHVVVEDAREDTATTASEATPLLQSDAGSRRISSALSTSTAILHDASHGSGQDGSRQQRKKATGDDDDDDDGEANYKVSRGRGLAIMVSVYILIFLQCKSPISFCASVCSMC